MHHSRWLIWLLLQPVLAYQLVSSTPTTQAVSTTTRPWQDTIHFYNESGTISSTDYAPNDTTVDYLFVIHTVDPHVIKIKFQWLSLKNNEYPCSQSVEVMNVNFGVDILAHLCGTTNGSITPYSIKSMGPGISLELYSSNPLEGNGFKVTYTSIAPTRTAKACGDEWLGHSNPWVVQLISNHSSSCYATIINNKWLVTVAHCFSNTSDPSHWLVQLTDRRNMNVSRILQHSKFNDSTLDYDVALVELNATLTFSSILQPACLPESYQQNYAMGKSCSIVYNIGGSLTGMLRFFWDQQLCSSPDVYGKAMTSRMLCTRIDICREHDGAPLLCRDVDRRWYLTGLSSWGKCDTKPDVFARVWKFLRFIKQNAI
ncbi:transmembrane protease serine 11E-like isoform X1 [Lethenteron reissneri]|uniref:transmembrane protease serine 11E-like isoform X1 n=1 Tax=Lethenteron reissneri TaxID=7753 RepID=UPI002AB5EED0|nr:transmembrane protease serine 11E-like isoform X1 [Lethenteron reissneri]XP_061403577.1 transmembrane protease serine 11E-like isoform X1 [Lethenteron reissneri]